MDPNLAGWVVVIVLVILGLSGTALPVIPGAPVLFAGLFLGAWLDDFEFVSRGTVVALGVMAMLTYAIDFVAGSFGAKKFGASSRAMVGAAMGAVVGLFFGLAGVLVGPFTGAFLGELSAQRSLGEAGRAGVGATLGLALGAASKLAMGLSMVGVFIAARLL